MANDEERKSPVSAGRTEMAGYEDQAIDEVPLYRRKRVLIPFLLLVLAAVAGLWYWFAELRNFVSTDDAFIDANRVAISSKITGRIARLTVDEGDIVKKGETLVQLDDADLRAQLELARSGLELARESLPLAQVNLDRAGDDWRRSELQFKSAIITKEQHTHAQMAWASAKAEFAIADARLNMAHAQLAAAETQLRNTLVVAPGDGVVAKRWLMEGDVAQAGQPIVSVYDLQTIWVTANLEETKLGRVVLGNDVEISVDTYHHHPFRGNVFLIGSYTASEFSLIPPNNAAGNFTKITQRVPLKISIAGISPDVRNRFPLRPGMSVEVRIKVR
jgi:membrane fusion protein, multidrug efflux system